MLLELSHVQAAPLASERVTPALNRATAGRIDSMVELMHREYASRLTLAAIAAAAHLTPSSASRLFARTTGSRVTTYLTVVRVNAACRLLRDTDLNVSGIARGCGFSNLSTFNRRFRDVKTMTPRDYRAGFSFSAAARR